MIRPGIDVFLDHDHFKGYKLGILTNQTGVTLDGKNNIEALLEHGFNLKKIYVPEHGLDGIFGGGETMIDYIHPKYGIPVISLYNEVSEFSPEIFNGIDVFLYDIQDITARFYTYISTLRSVMRTFEKYDLNAKILILDRPSFLGNTVQGTLPRDINYLACENITTRYAMTPGEFALYVKITNDMKIDLDIAKMLGYENGADHLRSGIKFIEPSSAIKNYDIAFMYGGTCLLEGTTLSEGRGTETPFLYIGAPDLPFIEIDAPGIEYDNVEFTPKYNKFKDQMCRGIKIRNIEHSIADPFKFTVLLLMQCYEKYKFEFIQPHFNRLAGGNFLTELIINGAEDEFSCILEEDKKRFEPVFIYGKNDVH